MADDKPEPDAPPDAFPRILARRRNRISPWVTIIEREVAFRPSAQAELYHAIDQDDYIAIVARTPDGRMPLVRQFRPAAEAFTWEFPAGMVDAGEDALACCRRELQEETGLTAVRAVPLGTYLPCSARLSNRIHSFFVETGPVPDKLTVEEGIELRLVTPAELGDMIRSGTFVLQLQIGALMLACMQGHVDIKSFG